MILLATHIWIWWVAQDAELSTAVRDLLTDHEADGLGH